MSLAAPLCSARVLLLSLAPLLLASGGCSAHKEEEDDKAAPVAVTCVAAVRGDLEERLLVHGRLAAPPGGELPLASQVSGRVNDVRVREGDRVEKGTVVATVDDLGPRAAASEAGAGVARSKASVANAEAALARARDLASRGIASQKDVEDAVARAAAAKADLEASAAGARAAAGALGRTDVRSAFAGVVTKIWRGPGGLVDGTAATPIVQIASVGALELVGEVTERDLARLREGQRVKIELLDGSKLEGGVLARAQSLDAATGLGAVRIGVDTLPDGTTPPPLGASARGVVSIGKREGVLSLPRSSFRGALADGPEIVVCKEGKAEVRKVKVGYHDEERVEVSAGLEPNEQVAVDHVLGLEDGTPLAPAQAKKP